MGALSSPHPSRLSPQLREYRQEDCDVVKIDVRCPVVGDVVLECLHVEYPDGGEGTGEVDEYPMFRCIFNTAFVRSNILMLNREDVDIVRALAPATLLPPVTSPPQELVG